MKSVSIYEAKTHLSALVAEVEDRQERITICRYGRAVAELVPIVRKPRTRIDQRLAKVVIKSDPTSPTVEEWEDA